MPEQIGRVPRQAKEFWGILALWKDVDPDVPLLQQAKAKYAKLP